MKRSQLVLDEDQLFENVAKAGQLMPGLELDIFDENFEKVPHDGETVGEILDTRIDGLACNNDVQPEQG